MSAVVTQSMPGRRGLEHFETLQYLEGRKFTPLETAAVLLDALGAPQNSVPAVHVGGTNGKGTVCALLGSILHAEGFSIGQTVSPHLANVTERCLVNGLPVSEEEYGLAIEAVMECAFRERLAPSYFVLGLVAAFYEFARRALDRMVVEVGLGGRYDATNLIARPLASVITSISEDHVDILGTSLAQIAWNKVGIAKRGVPLFVGRVPEEARATIAQGAVDAGAHCEFFGEDFSYDAADDTLLVGNTRRPAFLRHLPLAGAHQLENGVVAVRVAYALGVREGAIREGIARVVWPGRLEHIRVSSPGGDREMLLDVAHNPAGIEALVRYVRSIAPGRFDRVIYLISILDRKDWRSMIRLLNEGDPEAELVFTDSGYPGAVPPAELAAEGGGSIHPQPEAALKEILLRSDERTLVVLTGSVFLVGKLRSTVTVEPMRSIAAS